MIRIKPSFEIQFTCPECGFDEVQFLRVSVPGIYWLAECSCNKCSTNFLQSLPIGHMLDHPLAVGRDSQKLYPADWNMYWQSEPFLRSFINYKEDKVSIQKVVFIERPKVIILNTLDYLYGHTLLKLYNALHHLDNQQDLGLIIIIPRIFEWMIPKGCAEAWIVDLRLSELRDSYAAIDRFVTNECNRFDEIYASRAYSHPDFASIDIERLTGVLPFNVAEFYQKKPFFTFVLREDRWWLKNRISDLAFRVARKLKISRIVQKSIVRKQDALVSRTIRRIRRDIPEAEFCITGLGKGGSLTSWASDKRSMKITTDIERDWCQMYAKSHVVIGAHGSNMLLPTAHAAGCVEILMEKRNRNIIQDISVRYNDRRQLFFYRFVDQFASPASVASKVVAIYRHYENCYRNMVLHQYR